VARREEQGTGIANSDRKNYELRTHELRTRNCELRNLDCELTTATENSNKHDPNSHM
jgi:hypothetical protein